MRLILARSAHFFAILAAIAVLIGQLGAWHWFAELFSHYLPHCAVVFIVAALLCQGRKRGLWLVCSAGAVLWMLQPFALWQSNDIAPAHHLIWYNAHLNNPDAAQESARLIDSGADIIALAEVHSALPGWQILREHFPHGCEHRENSPFALALYSRTPLAQCDIRFTADFPYLRAVRTDGIVLYVLHPPPPIQSQLAFARDAYLQFTAARIAREDAALVVGDFNASPYSPVMRRFVDKSQLQFNTLYLTPTWRPFFLNIDHILTRGVMARSQALAWQSSDHRAIAVRYEIEK